MTITLYRGDGTYECNMPPGWPEEAYNDGRVRVSFYKENEAVFTHPNYDPHVYNLDTGEFKSIEIIETNCGVEYKEKKMTKKETNPKDAVGTRKPPMSTVSSPVLQEVGVAMLEGGRKYGRHNYRISGIRASVYYDATLRHLFSWWEGEDIDPDSEMSHITKAIASLVVLRDAMLNDMMTDDRPPSMDVDALRKNLQKRVDAIFDLYPDSLPAHVRGE